MSVPVKGVLLGVLVAAFVSGFSISHAQVTETGGVVIFEAEDFDANLSGRSGHDWSLANAVAGFGGLGYMEATPNTGANLATAGTANPELQFSVNFANTGAHYVWIRGYGATADDDSIYVGIDGGSSVAMTLTQTNAWQWSNSLQPSGAAMINIPSAGNHTVNLWMREDGMRIDRVVLTINASFSPTLGNAWHIPNNAEPAGVGSMRSPLTVPLGTDVTIYSGNQYQGSGGNPGNQVQTGSTVFYKRSTDASWSSVPMAFFSQAGNNKYFSATIPSGTFYSGDVIQYYLKIPYSDHLPTFLYGSDSQSTATEFESVAQTHPFTFNVKAPLTPANGAAFHSVDSVSGNFQVAHL